MQNLNRPAGGPLLHLGDFVWAELKFVRWDFEDG